MFPYSLTGKEGSGSGFGSWKTVPVVPVPRSVSGKTVPTVPVRFLSHPVIYIYIYILVYMLHDFMHVRTWASLRSTLFLHYE